MSGAGSKKTNAIITASYAPDFERCAILCETIDRHAHGYDCHYLLVDGPDRELFAKLAGPKRKLLTDTELLPWWFRRAPQAISPKKRRVWLSPLTPPMHGWHTQQIMRIAIAQKIDADGLLYCDSDTAFLCDYDLNDMWDGDAMRLWLDPTGAENADNDHQTWVNHSAMALNLRDNEKVDNNYVCSFVTWSRRTVVDMCRHIEDLHGKPWIAVVASKRKFSECMLYGAYVDGVLGGKGHVGDLRQLCPMHWVNPAPTDQQLVKMATELSDGQVGMGVQSTVPIDPERFRKVVIGATAAAA
ncbi:MAG: DUF6492 family protein [Pseudomonadota bacterium]